MTSPRKQKPILTIGIFSIWEPASLRVEQAPVAVSIHLCPLDHNSCGQYRESFGTDSILIIHSTHHSPCILSGSRDTTITSLVALSLIRSVWRCLGSTLPIHCLSIPRADEVLDVGSCRSVERGVTEMEFTQS